MKAGSMKAGSMKAGSILPGCSLRTVTRPSVVGSRSAVIPSTRTLPRQLVVAQPRAQSGNDYGPQEVSLVRRFGGTVEYTFVLAGFLKIVTMTFLVTSSPNDCARTAFGQASQYLLIPVALVMCWIAKLITDANLQYNKRFMTGLVGVLIFLYFFLYKLMYRYDPRPETIRAAPISNSSGPMLDARRRMGDRDISGRTYSGNSRGVYPTKGGKKGEIDDLAYYEGRYPSQIEEDKKKADGGRKVEKERVELDARNPLRGQARGRSRREAREEAGEV